jgi:sigma-B regulation protein RsbU (phosphoserine phosphatase)
MTEIPSNPNVQELALAAELQAALLPKQCLHCEHQRSAARNRMCGSVGGDFYDFIRVSDDQIALVIGDMVGHGVRASLLMANIMGWLRSDPRNHSKPIKVVSALNEMLIELGNRVGTPTPCSLFYMVIDQPTGLGLFVNAGHPRPFLCDRENCSTLHLGSRNMLLGVEEFTPEEGCNIFTPGQRLVMYTDGILDTINATGDRFGPQRLGELVNQNHSLSPEQLTDTVFTEIDKFRGNVPQVDDETILVFDRL